METHKNSDSTCVNYNIKHTWGGKSPHCKDPFHARQKSTPALQPCPALPTTVQRRWPGKPELDLHWRTLVLGAVYSNIHTYASLWSAGVCSQDFWMEEVGMPLNWALQEILGNHTVLARNRSTLLLSKLVQAAETYFIYIYTTHLITWPRCMSVRWFLMTYGRYEWKLHPGVISVAPASVWPPVLGWPTG